MIQQVTMKDGRIGYRVREIVGKYPTGETRYKTKTVDGTKRDAVQMESIMRSAKERADRAQTEAEIYALCQQSRYRYNPVKIKDAYDKAMEKPGMCASSGKRIEFHRNYWDDFVAWIGKTSPTVKDMQEITPSMCEEYISFIRKNGSWKRFESSGDLGVAKLANATLNEMQGTLKQIFSLLRHDTGMLENPMDGIKRLPLQQVDREAFSQDQLRIIFDKADDFLYPMFFIGLLTGLSEGDVCTLRKDEIFFDSQHIYRKRRKTAKSTGKICTIPMLPVLSDYLKELLDDRENTTEYVLPKQKALYDEAPSTLSRMIKRFLEDKCGFETQVKADGRGFMSSKLDFHSLRHTFCSLSGSAGVPLTVVQSVVGHMTERMTELYSRHVDEKDRLNWIKVLGNKLASDTSCLPAAVPEIPSIEPEREKLLNLVKTMDMDTVKTVLELIGK